MMREQDLYILRNLINAKTPQRAATTGATSLSLCLTLIGENQTYFFERTVIIRVVHPDDHIPLGSNLWAVYNTPSL